VLNELYLTWDGSNSGWEKRDEYVGVEVEFNSLLSGKKIKRVMIPNVGDFWQPDCEKAGLWQRADHSASRVNIVQ